jgi:hypothetical protein
MAILFTICSNNYLAQATVLGHSIQKHFKNVQLFTVLVDEYAEGVDYSDLPFTTILIKDIEPGIDLLSEKYMIVELNACVKPAVFKYFFENYNEKQVFFFDPDIVVYDSMPTLDLLFESFDILLTPHTLTPAPVDGKKPSDNTFLNYGLYNLGFIGIQKSVDSMQFINWWKERTYLNGFAKVQDGVFADQLYINLVPIFFKKVCVIDDMGWNMAPWNLHERYLAKRNGAYIVNDHEPLKFFHFGSFKLNSNELPVHYYNRFLLNAREDLRALYTEYNQNLSAAGYSFFQSVDCIYYEQFIDKRIAVFEKAEQKRWDRKSYIKRLLLSIIPKSLFTSLQSRLQKIINAYPRSVTQQLIAGDRAL